MFYDFLFKKNKIILKLSKIYFFCFINANNKYKK